jgi:hypothetical protein
MAFDGIRELIDKYRPLFIGVMIGLVGLAIIISIRSTTASRVYTISGSYFSADDGKTFFKAAFDKPPFVAPDGKSAVIAHVFTSDGGATKFVGYLSRPVTKGSTDGNKSPSAADGPVEVKSPGEGHSWIPTPPPGLEETAPAMVAFLNVVNVKSPDGRPAMPLVPEN